MIPASYLFKDVYHQHWDEPDAPVRIARHHRFPDGLLNPFAGISATIARRRRARTHYFGAHAYD